MPSLTPRALRCEYREAPTGIGEHRPRLSWKLESTERGDAQTGYRLLVAAEPLDGELTPDQALVWDSGWVDTADQLGVEYAGAPLVSTTRYAWQVRVRDATGAEAGTARPEFVTGILHQDEWRAAWIGRDWATRSSTARRRSGTAGRRSADCSPRR